MQTLKKFRMSYHPTFIGVVVIPLSLLLGGGCSRRTCEDELAGKWSQVEMWGEFKFDLPTVFDSRSTHITFGPSGFNFRNGPDAEHAVSGTFICHREKSPPQITFIYPNRRLTAIYRINGNTLVICVGRDDETPPSRFDSGSGSRPALLFFRRATP